MPSNLAKRRIAWHGPSKSAREITYHEVYILDLKAGGQYVLDITCAQYGRSDPIVPLERYE